MAVETNPTNPPKKANGFPIKWAKAPTVPLRDCRPKTYSAIISGMLHKKRNIIHATKNEPAPFSPPFVATIRGKRQMLPVPIAMPRALIRNVNRDEKRGAALLMSDSWLLFILIFNKKGKVKLKYRMIPK